MTPTKDNPLALDEITPEMEQEMADGKGDNEDEQ